MPTTKISSGNNTFSVKKKTVLRTFNQTDSLKD